MTTTKKATKVAKQAAKKHTKDELVKETLQLIINFSGSLKERKDAVRAIKDAMSAAIMLTVEINEESFDAKHVEVYTELYREAKTIQGYLKYA